MSKVTTLFESSDLSGVNNGIVAYIDMDNELFIEIYSSGRCENEFICLDLDTAIEFVEHLERLINIINENK